MNKEEKDSKQRALELWDSGKIEHIEVGTTKGLQEIHAYLFHNLEEYDAGKIRTINLAKGHFRFASAMYLNEALSVVEKMPEESFSQIIEKYIEMNIAHPFREGNGRATRIWLDQILKKNLNQCIDWSKVNKRDYLHFMELSPVEGKYIENLLEKALTDEIDSRVVYMKGIDQSYKYEAEDSISIFEIDEKR